MAQSLGDFEVICVDDGSTDESAAILSEYASRDLRVKVTKQIGVGAGRARNTGLVQATGKWLAFLDSDDEFDPSMFAEMSAAGDCAGADVVACTVASGGDMFRRWRGWAWDKLFRRDFVARLGLEFQDLPVSNDLLFTYSALALASKVEPIGKSYVFHRKRPGSVETTRDKYPLAPIAAVRALHARIGSAEGFVRWVPDFLFWHINRMKTEEASKLLYSETERFGCELGIRFTRKWVWEEIKHIIKRALRKVARCRSA